MIYLILVSDFLLLFDFLPSAFCDVAAGIDLVTRVDGISPIHLFASDISSLGFVFYPYIALFAAFSSIRVFVRWAALSMQGSIWLLGGTEYTLASLFAPVISPRSLFTDLRLLLFVPFLRVPVSVPPS